MMTSDMTPDMNGNFERQPSNEKQEMSGTNPMITNRVSHTQTITHTPNLQDLTVKEEYSQERPKQTEDPLMESADMKLSQSFNFIENQ